MPTRRDAETADDSSLPTGASEYFDDVLRTCLHSMEMSGAIEHSITIGTSRIRLVFAGPALVDVMLPALRHLSDTSRGPADFTIYLMDSRSTGVSLPESPWGRNGIPAENLGADGQGRLLYHDDRYRMYFYLQQTIYLADFKTRRAFFWTPDAYTLPYYESGAPVRTLLHWIFSAKAWQMIHAACVGTEEGGVLLAGKGGSGKSTTALACLADGFSYVGDDYCLLSISDGPVAHSVFSSAKVNADNLERLPFLRDAMVNRSRLETEKALFFVADQFPDRIARQLRINAILLPSVTGRPDTEVRRGTAASGLFALAPSTLFQLSDIRQTAFDLMSRLARTVPVFELLLGTRIEQIPAVVRLVCESNNPNAE